MKGTAEPNVSFANMSSFKDYQQSTTVVEGNKVPRIRLNQVDSSSISYWKSQDR